MLHSPVPQWMCKWKCVQFVAVENIGHYSFELAKYSAVSSFAVAFALRRKVRSQAVSCCSTQVLDDTSHQCYECWFVVPQECRVASSSLHKELGEFNLGSFAESLSLHDNLQSKCRGRIVSAEDSQVSSVSFVRCFVRSKWSFWLSEKVVVELHGRRA